MNWQNIHAFRVLYMRNGRTRAEQKEQPSNAENIRVWESWGDEVECIHVGKSHSNINVNGKTNQETNQK